MDVKLGLIQNQYEPISGIEVLVFFIQAEPYIGITPGRYFWVQQDYILKVVNW